MRTPNQGGMKICSLSSVTCFVVSIFGCATMALETKVSSTERSAEKERRAARYCFVDIPVPADFKLPSTSDFVFQHLGRSTCMLSFVIERGIITLSAFFTDNMSENSWQSVSSYNPPKAFIMIYHKDDRWCVINLKEREHLTFVEIWVAPTTGESTESSSK